MIESIENIVQIIVLIGCMGVALYRGFGKDRSGAWTCVMFFFGSRLLGDLYWQMCLFYYGDTPDIALISDLSWYASILFLYLLVRMEIGGKLMSGGSFWRRTIPMLGPVFTFAMAAFYMQWGQYISNILYALLMGLLIYAALHGLLVDKPEDGGLICLLVLVFFLMEYGTWTASCFSDIDLMQYLYYGFDTLITISCPFYIPVMTRMMAKKASEPEPVGGGDRSL